MTTQENYYLETIVNLRADLAKAQAERDNCKSLWMQGIKKVEAVEADLAKAQAETKLPCDCGNPDGWWHETETGLRFYCCKKCYARRRREIVNRNKK